MKYFICALDTIQIGIMAQKTERIIQSDRTLSSVFETQTNTDEEIEAFISLPALLMQKNTDTPHTLVLKSSVIPSSQLKAKLFLLTPKIDNELDIPEEHIHQLPLALNDLRGYIKGIYFSGQTVQTMVLILNIDTLLERIS